MVLPLLVTALALTAYLVTCSPSISWSDGVSDSGELAAAAYVLGVPHPTGYPLYMLVGWAASHVPISADPGYRLALFSALCGAAASGLACAVTLALAGLAGARSRRGCTVGALVAGLGCAASPALWRQATAPETRSFALALALGVLLLLLRALSTQRASLLLAAWALWGVALADHLLCLALFPALLLLTRHRAGTRAAGEGAAPCPRTTVGFWLRCLFAVLPGLCLYAYLPLRATAHPALDWGDPRTLDRFVWEVSGAQYRSLMGLSLTATPQRLADRLADLWGAPGGTLLIAGVVGLLLLCRLQPLTGLALLLTCVAGFVQSAFYAALAAPIYLLPCESLLCVGAGFLVLGLWRLPARPWLRPLPGLAVGLLVWVSTVQDAGPAQALRAASTASPAVDYARQALAVVPRHTVLLATGDDASFSLWYAQFALGIRPDVAVINTDLLAWTWYRGNLAYHYPWLRWGDAWQPDAAVRDPNDRAEARQAALVQASAGILPIYWTDPLEMQTDVCGMDTVGSLYRCVPLPAQHR